MLKMKKWLAGMVIVGGLFQTVSVTTVSADTLDEIKTQEEAKQSELNELQATVSQALAKINGVNNRVNELEQEVKDKEATIVKTEADITAQKQIVEDRLTQAKDRLKSIQTTEMNQNVILSILESDNISDMLHRAYVLVTLQSAGNEQIELAQEAYDELTELQQLLSDEKQQLVEKTDEAVAEKEELDQQVASLQQVIDENRSALTQLAEKRQVEEARIAEEKRQADEERIAAENRAAQEKAQAAMTAANKQTPVASFVKNATPQETKVEATSKKEEPKKEEPKQEEPKKQEAPKETASSSSSKTLTVSATGYSTQQANLSTHTATGIDLRVNPMVIAVDPSVIPLGTMVEVPGYGIAIAGDTGGAIKGNKIDIHFTSVSQALSFGRRNITIKILN